MKNNLILFGILVVLISGTYFLQEKKDRQLFNHAIESEIILKEPVTQIQWDNFVINKTSNKWMYGDKLLSANHFGRIEKGLKNLKKIKDIQGDISKVLPNSVKLKINGHQFSFGQLTLQKDGFYLAQDNKIYIATFDEEILHSENENPEEKKLTDFLNLFPHDIEALVEKQFFRYYVDLEFDQAQILTEGAQPYKIDFSSNKTIPSPIHGIEEHENLKAKFLSLFTQMMIKNELEYPKNKLFKKMSDLNFSNKGKDQLNFELWLKSNSNADAIILDPKNKKAYEMIGGSLRTFFIQVQDYWDKKVIPPASFKSFEELDVTLFEGNKEAKFKILNREPLQFKSSLRLNEEEVRVLFTYIFNLGEKDQADRVSQVSTMDREIIQKENLLRVLIFGQDLYILKKREELIITNLTQGFKAHFGMVDEKFPVHLKDMIR